MAALVEWHRRRRQSGALASQSCAQSLPSGDASPDGFQLDSPYDSMPCSPVSCPSPAEFVREDLVRRNVRQVQAEYEFEQALGEGSFGRVHQARHRRTGILRAVKEIPRAGTEGDEFEYELKALVALDHPHIVKVIEYFVDPEKYYLVTELCTGPDIFTYVLDSMEKNLSGFMPENEVSVILRQCLKSVLCCHAHGFVHRDLNAKNFMITGSDRTIKLIDFGLATRFLGFVPQDQFIEIVGTSHYMAPEMMLHGKYSPAVDIWALGVLLYVLLTGLMLLPKEDDRKKRLLAKGFVQRKISTCSQLQKRASSPQVLDLLKRMLQQEPLKRISALESLSHPFVLNHCHDYLGPPFDDPQSFDVSVVEKLRHFAKSPRLKKVALLFMAHLADHERDLMVARHTFRTMDHDGDGEISIEDLQTELEAHNLTVPQDLQQIFLACGGSNAGKLTFVEFLACLLPRRLVDERFCHEAFSLLDPEGSGQLTAESLQAVCHSYSRERCEKMVRQADLSGKQWFDFEDFHRFMCGPTSPQITLVEASMDTLEERSQKLARHEGVADVGSSALGLRED